jgi:hypothetical protein
MTGDQKQRTATITGAGMDIDTQRYEALFRISETLSVCGEPEKLA